VRKERKEASVEKEALGVYRATAGCGLQAIGGSAHGPRLWRRSAASAAGSATLGGVEMGVGEMLTEEEEEARLVVLCRRWKAR
jgi:hypothetical protein